MCRLGRAVAKPSIFEDLLGLTSFYPAYMGILFFGSYLSTNMVFVRSETLDGGQIHTANGDYTQYRHNLKLSNFKRGCKTHPAKEDNHVGKK